MFMRCVSELVIESREVSERFISCFITTFFTMFVFICMEADSLCVNCRKEIKKLTRY